jgi:hypothetical protein
MGRHRREVLAEDDVTPPAMQPAVTDLQMRE